MMTSPKAFRALFCLAVAWATLAPVSLVAQENEGTTPVPAAVEPTGVKDMPIEMMFKIFRSLARVDLKSCSLVSRHWHQLIMSRQFWEGLSKELQKDDERYGRQQLEPTSKERELIKAGKLTVREMTIAKMAAREIGIEVTCAQPESDEVWDRMQKLPRLLERGLRESQAYYGYYVVDGIIEIAGDQGNDDREGALELLKELIRIASSPEPAHGVRLAHQNSAVRIAVGCKRKRVKLQKAQSHAGLTEHHSSGRLCHLGPGTGVLAAKMDQNEALRELVQECFIQILESKASTSDVLAVLKGVRPNLESVEAATEQLRGWMGTAEQLREAPYAQSVKRLRKFSCYGQGPCEEPASLPLLD